MIVKPGRLLDTDILMYSSGGGGGTLLLDTLTSATFAYSTRLLRTAYAGKCMNVRRSSDSATQDIGFDGSGNFDVTAFNAFVGGGNGFCAKWYDQSGNGNDVAQSTAGQQPQVVLAVQNGHPIVRMVGANTTGLVSTQTVTVQQTFVGAAVAARRDSPTSYMAIFSDQSGGGVNSAWFGFANSAGKMEAIAGNVGFTISGVSETVFHSAAITYSGSGSVINVDGVEQAGSLLSGGWLLSPVYIGYDPPSGDRGDNDIGEAVVWPSGVSRTTIITNLRAYWGTP